MKLKSSPLMPGYVVRVQIEDGMRTYREIIAKSRLSGRRRQGICHPQSRPDRVFWNQGGQGTVAFSETVTRDDRKNWRYFASREVKAARAWIRHGGIAVHENIFRLRDQRTCHLLARDEPALIEAARSLGCRDQWIHRSRTPHFDLIGPYLERALERCRG